MSKISKIISILTFICLSVVASCAQTQLLQFTEVQFVDETNGWILGNDGTRAYLLTTVDSCKTWSSQELHLAITRFKFLDDDLGFATADAGAILLTRNGGRTWTIHESGSRN